MTTYPGKIDTDAELPAVNDNITELSGEAINAIREAVLIIEKTLGVNPQGVQNTVTERLSQSLNSDGTLKSSALNAAGLVSLPITNNQVGSSAAIVESKLDLDVPTQTLQDQITSNDADIWQLQDQLGRLVLRYTRHVTGADEKHLSSHIVHTAFDGYEDGTGTSVKNMLDYLYGYIEIHKAEQQAVEHYASAIKYVPRDASEGESPIVTQDNVQLALEELDLSLIEDRRRHNDEAHSDGVSDDGYTYLGGQAVVNDASLKPIRYQSFGLRDQIKFGLCNAATVKSKGFNPTNIGANSNRITIETRIGAAIRSITIADIHNLSYPLGVSRVTLAGVVDYLNSKFADTSAAVHFPVTAFASNDGEIVLQHNIARDDCSITIKDPGVQSAIDALGFSEVAEVEVGRYENYVFYVDGSRFTELKTVYDGYAIHPSTDLVDRFNAGVLVDSSGLNLLRGDLLHIYNHSGDDAANGTYQVDSIIGSTVELTEALSFGSFNFVIYRDSVTTNEFTGSERGTLDLFIDKDRQIYTKTRADINYGSTDGVRIVEVSQDFPAHTGMKLILSTSSGSVSAYLEDSSGNVGVARTFIPGFIGYLKLFSPDNISYITIFIHKVTIASGFATFDTFLSEKEDSNLLLGSTHVDAATNEIEFPLDRRNIGLVALESIGSSFYENILERDIRNMHLNGVVRGFDIISTTSTSITVRGGAAYIDGRLVEIPTRTVAVDTVNAGIYNLILDKEGNYDIFEEGTGSSNSLSVAELIGIDNKLLLGQIIVAGNAVIDTADARFFINDVESKFKLTIDDRDLGAGLFRSFEAAVLYAKYAYGSSKTEISILTDLVVEDDLIVDSTAKVVAFGKLTMQGSLELSSNADVEVLGDFVAVGDVVLGDNSRLTLRNDSDFQAGLGIGTGALLEVGGTAAVSETISVSGPSAKIIGDGYSAMMVFSGITGIEANQEDLKIVGLTLQMDGSNSATARNPIVSLLTGGNRFEMRDCKLRQSGDVSALNWANALDENRVGIRVPATQSISGMKLHNVEFENFYFGIDVAAGDKLRLSECYLHSCNVGLRAGHSSASTVNNLSIGLSSMENNSSGYVKLFGNNISVTGCFFGTQFAGSLPYIISCAGASNVSLMIENNVFSSLDMSTGIDVTGVTGSSSISISGNSFYSTRSDVLVKNSGATNQNVSTNFIGNTVRQHQGRIFTGNNFNFSANEIEIIDTLTGGDIIVLATEDSPYLNSAFCSNRITASKLSGNNDTELRFSTGLVDGNSIVAGKLSVYAPVAAGSNSSVLFTGNVCTLSGGGLMISAAEDGQCIVSGNRVYVDSDAIAIDVAGTSGDRNIIITDNALESAGNATEVLRVGSDTTGGYWIVSNNTVRAEVNRGISINTSNAVVTDNIVYNASTDDIYVSPIVTQVYVSGNFLESGSVNYPAASPNGVYIGPNKGATSSLVRSVYEATFGSGWTIESGYYSSSAVGAVLYFPLELPEGAQLVSVDTVISTLPANSINIKLMRIDGFSETSIGQVFNPGSHGSGPLTVSPSSTEFVQPGKAYYLKITSSTIGDRVSYADVKVKY